MRRSLFFCERLDAALTFMDFRIYFAKAPYSAGREPPTFITRKNVSSCAFSTKLYERLTRSSLDQFEVVVTAAGAAGVLQLLDG